MGLSSKQVSSDGNGWNQALLVDDARTLPIKTQEQQQQQQQQPEQLKCPRCDSSNTKFCYYNNYNKTQPRHFCKACKRHWTKGGTLRNVPVGGGRKNKRLKMSKTASKTTTTTTTTPNNLTTLQPQQIRASSLPLGGQFPSSVVEDKLFSEAFYQNFLKQQHSSLQDHSITFNSKGLNDGIYLNSTIKTTSLGLSSHQQHHDNQEIQQFPYSNNNLGNFESTPCSISSTITSNHSPILYNFTGDQVTNDQQEEEQEQLQPWNNNMHTLSSTRNNNNHNNVMEMMPNNNWGWDDFDKFVSVEADLTIPWDDTDIKP